MLEAVLVLNSEIRLNMKYFKTFYFLTPDLRVCAYCLLKNLSRLDM